MPVQSTSIPFRQTGKFSALFCDYAENHPQLSDFHSGFPDIPLFQEALDNKAKSYPGTVRDVLHRNLEIQTRSVAYHPAQEDSLKSLASTNCFTVSCGHQLCIGGGPQYMLFKILSTIRLAEVLQRQFPSYKFVPVFWLAGEDHDIEEIRHLRFFSKDYPIDVHGSGPCGRLKTDGVAEQLRAIPDFPESMTLAYENAPNLSEATRKWLHSYFGKLGLLVLDADCPELKKIFLPEMLAEFGSPTLASEVRNQTARLEKMGYSAQLHCRDLNLFLMEDGSRIRLEKNAGMIHTIGGTQKWSADEAIDYFTAHPEKLSPNACLRPLYSQKILPDIAFVGGPAEVAYWLQLKSAFELYEIPFPLLIPRYSGLNLPQVRRERLEKLGLRPEELFDDVQHLRQKISLGEDKLPEPDLETAFAELVAYARKLDPGTAASLEADISRAEDLTRHMLRKVRKAAEKKAETQLRQLENLLDYCFPEGGLLERSESWLSGTVQDPNLISSLMASLDPMDFQFRLLTAAE